MDYSRIDRISQHVPTSVCYDVKKLAPYLAAKGKDEHEIARAFFNFIARNITYDKGEYQRIKWFLYTGFDKSNKVLKNRKGICGEIANLYHQMCEIVGVEDIVVFGEARVRNKFGGYKLEKHAWNLTRMDSNWVLVDATWGMTSPLSKHQMRKLGVDKKRLKTVKGKWVPKFFKDMDYTWFDVDPDSCIQTHLPDLVHHQMLEKPFLSDGYLYKQYHRNYLTENLECDFNPSKLCDFEVDTNYTEKSFFMQEMGSMTNGLSQFKFKKLLFDRCKAKFKDFKKNPTKEYAMWLVKMFAKADFYTRKGRGRLKKSKSYVKKIYKRIGVNHKNKSLYNLGNKDLTPLPFLPFDYH